MSERDVCDNCGADMELVQDIPDELLAAALRFYEGSPDGQYDLDVVVPLLQAEVRRRAL